MFQHEDRDVVRGMQQAEEEALINNIALTVNQALAHRAKICKEYEFIDSDMHPFLTRVKSIVDKSVCRFYGLGGART